MNNIQYTYWPLNENGPLNDKIFDSNFLYDCVFKPKDNAPPGIIRKTVKSLFKKHSSNQTIKETLSIKNPKDKDVKMVTLLSNTSIGRNSLKNFDTKEWTSTGDFTVHIIHGGIKTQIKSEEELIHCFSQSAFLFLVMPSKSGPIKRPPPIVWHDTQFVLNICAPSV